jgi:hypothetical protein
MNCKKMKKETENIVQNTNLWPLRPVEFPQLMTPTKFARRVWYLKEELEKFLQNKTEQR